MKIHLRLFALAKELIGSPIVEVDLPEGSVIADLRRSLTERMPAMEAIARISMFAVASQYVSNEFALKEGDEVACIPPVSGG